jgi:hypothetical protein
MNNMEVLRRDTALQHLGRKIIGHEDVIQQIIAQAGQKANEAVAEALLCGQSLIEAKDLVAHGEWYDWLKANEILRDPVTKTGCMSESTIERYMSIARNPSRVKGASSVNQALILLTGATRDHGEPKQSPLWLTWLNRTGQMREKFLPIINEIPDESAAKFCEDLNAITAAAKAKWPGNFV